jgi:hypothetical protein
MPSQSGANAEPASPIPIVFDTSVLRTIGEGVPSPEFKLLGQLAHAGKVALWVPEMAFREWMSQRTERGEELLAKLGKVLEDLRGNRGIASQGLATELLNSESLSEVNINAIREGARNWHEGAFLRMGFRIVSLTLEDAKQVLDAYAGGKPPFASKRKREDLPDGFVLAGVAAIFKSDSRAIFACNDTRLSEAAKATGVAVVGSISDLLKSPNVASLHANPAFALWWEQNFTDSLAKLRDQEPRLRKSVEDAAIDALSSTEIEHPEIPDDNNQAWVFGASLANEITFDWENAESSGEGLLTVPLAFEADLELQFSVYRMDAFSVPNWVRVRLGDFEEDHYFEASGSRRAAFWGRMVLSFEDQVMADGVDLDVAELSVEDLELREFTDKVGDLKNWTE